MPDCECRTAVYATGNNITFKGDMVRRGLVCNLEALTERPELRSRASFWNSRLGSYSAWSTMVRSPLVWLNEPDPITSVDSIRQEDPELSNIREFFGLWLAYDLGLDTPYTTSRIIEVAIHRHAAHRR